MQGQQIGSTIAAVFGLVYVLVNAQPLPGPWTVVLSVLAVVAFIAVLIAVVRMGRPVRGSDGGRHNVFGRAYWTVVVIEFVALFAGARILSGPLNTSEAGVAWVSLVVGTHFFALAVIFRAAFFHILGAAITACGVVGLILALTGAGEPTIAFVGGVLPGAILLGFGWWGARHTVPDPAVSA